MKKIVCLSCLLFPITAWATNGIYIDLSGGTAFQTNLPSAQSIGAKNKAQTFGLNAFRATIGYNHDFTQRFGAGLQAGVGSYSNTQYTYASRSVSVKEAMSEVMIAEQYALGRVTLLAAEGALTGKASDQGPVLSPPPKPNAKTVIFAAPALNLGAAYNFNRFFALTASYLYSGGMLRIHEPKDSTYREKYNIHALLFGMRLTFAG